MTNTWRDKSGSPFYTEKSPAIASRGMAPILVFKGRHPFMALGTPGGSARTGIFDPVYGL